MGIAIVGGGRTGAESAGLRAAKRFGLAWGKTYRSAAKLNILNSDATIVFDRSNRPEEWSRGTHWTAKTAGDFGRPVLVVAANLDADPTPGSPEAVTNWFEERRRSVLNVAGNRESKARGVGAWVEAYLCGMFRAMGYREFEG